MDYSSTLQDLSSDIYLNDLSFLPIEPLDLNTLYPAWDFQPFYPPAQAYPVYQPVPPPQELCVVRKKAKPRKKKQKIDINAPLKPKRNTGLNKPLILSPALSEIMHMKELSRPELVQKLWKYIKEHDLQDPADRRFILCDTNLKKIFLQDRVNSFGMNKDLSAHLTKKEEILSQ